MQYKEKYKKTIAPLLDTVWGTEYPYNAYCPIPSKRKKAKHNPPGCNAVTFAQIVKYWADRGYINDGENGDDFTVRSSWTVESDGKKDKNSIANGNVNLGYNVSKKKTFIYTTQKKKIDIKSLKNIYTFYDYQSASFSGNADENQITPKYDTEENIYTLKHIDRTNARNSDAIANFMLDCALSIGSTFGIEGSTSANDSYAFTSGITSGNTVYDRPSIFKLHGVRISDGPVKPQIEKSENDGTLVPLYCMSFVEDIIYEELYKGRPVAFSASTRFGDGGHIFVIDGYDNGLFHVNWGWAGKYDGWFKLNTLSGTFGRGHKGKIGMPMSYDCYYGCFMVYPTNENYNVGRVYGDYFSDRYYAKEKFVTEAPKYNDGRKFIDNIKVKRIGTELADGIVGRDQYFDIEIVNNSKYYFYEEWTTLNLWAKNIDTNAVIQISKDSSSNDIPVTMSPGEICKYRLNTDRFSGFNLPAGSYQLFLATRTQSNRLKGLDGNVYYAPFEMVDKGNPMVNVGDIGFEVLSGITENKNSSGKITSYTTHSNSISFVVKGINNPNNFPITTIVSVWLCRLKYGSSYTWSRYNDGYFDESVDYFNSDNFKFPVKIPANTTDYRVPFSFQGLPEGKRIQFRVGAAANPEDDDSYGHFGTAPIDVRSHIKYYTSKGNLNQTIAVTNNIVIPENALAVNFSSVDISGITITPNSNPNTIYVFGTSQTVPSSLSGKNVVIGKTAAIINFYEGYDVMFPITFTATKVVYHYTPKVGVTKGIKKGWQTISFPFDVKEVKCEGNIIDWFHSDTDTNKQFWLKGFTGVAYDNLNGENPGYMVEWEDVDKIENNTSYIIAFPGSSYGPFSLVDKDITFEGENVTFSSSVGFGFGDDEDKTVNGVTIPHENVVFYPEAYDHEVWNSSNYKQITAVVDLCGTTIKRNECNIYKLTINSNGESEFVYSEDAQEIKPFEAYFKDAYRRGYNDSYTPSGPNRIKGNTQYVKVEAPLEETEYIELNEYSGIPINSLKYDYIY